MGHSSIKRRVAVTGIGAVTPLGVTMADTWRELIAGRNPARLIRQFDASQFPCQIAYEVDDGFGFDPDLIEPREMVYLNRAAQFGCHATVEALEQAKFDSAKLDARRVAVCIGVGAGSTGFAWNEDCMIPGRYDSEAVLDVLTQFPNQLGSVIARMVQARGGVTTIHTACSSSGQAIGEAYERIVLGEADLVVTGGADSMIAPFHLAGFGLLGALSGRNDYPAAACRPFDAQRDGFVLGEGACTLILEDFDHALARGAEIIGEICGYGITESAYRITDLHPEGIGPIEAMQMALDDSGITADQVGYVNAHGTSTLLNDRVEALAIHKVFGKSDLRVSSTKSMTGHMIAAAGAIELAFCIKALQEQMLPPSINLDSKDAECLVQLTASTAERATLTHALSNSIGFGGSNTALVARKVTP